MSATYLSPVFVEVGPTARHLADAAGFQSTVNGCIHVHNLERALANASGDEAEAGLRQGVALTLKAFVDALAKHGVRPIQAQGRPFDPELHEAAGAVHHPALPPGTVVRVEQKGYTVGDKLLRPARVLVATG